MKRKKPRVSRPQPTAWHRRHEAKQCQVEIRASTGDRNLKAYYTQLTLDRRGDLIVRVGVCGCIELRSKVSQAVDVLDTFDTYKYSCGCLL